MKSLKVKKVVLKNPHLRNLRRNLRIILKLANKDEIHRLHQLHGLYLEKYSQGKQTHSQERRETQISRLSGKIMALERRSCITCHEPYCKSYEALFGENFKKKITANEIKKDSRIYDLDMVWIPWYEKWVCLECYEAYYKSMTFDDFINSFGEALVVCGQYDERVSFLRKKFGESFVNK